MSARPRRPAAKRIATLARIVAIAAITALGWTASSAAATVGELTLHPGEGPRRLLGYGLVVGLDGTGDRSFGQLSGGTPTVRSVVNLLRRFDIEVPAERLRLRNVAAVLVTAEISPYLRSGGRFEVQVSALGDATSLRGGVLWNTPLVTDPDQPPLATAQGRLVADTGEGGRTAWARRANSGRIPDGGALEADPPPTPLSAARLQLREPDLGAASRIAAAVNAAFGAGTAKVADPGAVTLIPGAGRAADIGAFLAAVDSLPVVVSTPGRVVIDARAGTVVAGGDLRVSAAVVVHRGVTLQIGGAIGGADSAGMVRVGAEASVLDVAAGLHAAGVEAESVAAIFEALRAQGALRATVVIR